MRNQTPIVKAPVNKTQLKKAIMDHLVRHRQESPYVQFQIDPLWFEDGHWRTIVKPRKSLEAGQYAGILAKVEEELLDEFGVNVILIPARSD